MATLTESERALKRLAPSYQDKELFQIGRLGDDPKVVKQFIFTHTGHRGTKMSFREWCMFNTSLNRTLDIGMDQTSLVMMSLMDESLQYAHRFAGMPHVHELLVDSAAAHSTQVVRTIHEIYKKAFPKGLKPPEEAKTFIREAMIGAKIHDMGEIFGEPCTASEFFSLTGAERANISILKNEFEQQNFEFACALASHAVKTGNFGLFIETMKSIRENAAPELKALKTQPMAVAEHVQCRIAILSKHRDAMKVTLPDLGTLLPEAEKLRDIYHRTEEAAAGNFIHPLVKSAETIEGQRYMQRNSQEPVTSNLCYQTSFDTVESCWRAERRLPMLFQEATQEWQKQLARATAAHIYALLARGFDGLDADGIKKEAVSVGPPIIQRDADRSETPTAAIIPEFLDAERSRSQRLLQEKLENGAPAAADGRIMRREELASWYRAAQHAVTHYFYEPRQASLARFADTEILPDEILRSMTTLEMPTSSAVAFIGTKPGRGLGQ